MQPGSFLPWWTERSQPLKWTFEIFVFKPSRSASSLGDHAGNGQSKEGKRNEHEPERRLLLSSDQAAGKEDAQKEELQLHDSDNYTIHRLRPWLFSNELSAADPGLSCAQILSRT